MKKINIKDSLYSKKYEILLLGLLQHIFAGLIISDMNFYATTLWPISMVLLGVSTIGIFHGKSKTVRMVFNVLLFLVIILPLTGSIYEKNDTFMQVVSLLYTAYFGVILYEVMRFLLRPGKVTASVLFASVGGFFLILEIFVFCIQYMYYHNPKSISHIYSTSVGGVFIDIVYFCTMVLTSIGFGDIVPSTHKAKLLTSLMGILAQVYNVVLVGILISRFSNLLPEPKPEDE